MNTVSWKVYWELMIEVVIGCTPLKGRVWSRGWAAMRIPG